MARPHAGLIPALALASAWAGAAAAKAPGDRYGPAPATAPQPDVYASPARTQTYSTTSRETMRAPPARMLSWPGKADASVSAAPSPTTPPSPQAVQARPTQTARALPQPRYAAAPAAQAYAPPIAAWAPSATTVSPQFAAPTALPAAPPLPYFAAPSSGTPPPASTSLGDPLASTAPVASTQHARLYSVHREYGMQPDPAPIPPQFFAQTADLSAPATPEPVPNRAANAASRNAVNAARLAAADAN